MLRNFYPSRRVQNVFQIDYAELYEEGYRGAYQCAPHRERYRIADHQ